MFAEKTGMNLHKSSNVKKVEKNSSGSLTVHIDSLDKPLENVDVLLWAIGRHANTDHLAPDVIKLELMISSKSRQTCELEHTLVL